MSPPEYGQELWRKAIDYGTVYDEERLKGIVKDSLQKSVWRSVRKYWSENPEADLDELARHEKLMEILRGDKPSADFFDEKSKEGRSGGSKLVVDNDEGSAST